MLQAVKLIGKLFLKNYFVLNVLRCCNELLNNKYIIMNISKKETSIF